MKSNRIKTTAALLGMCFICTACSSGTDKTPSDEMGITVSDSGTILTTDTVENNTQNTDEEQNEQQGTAEEPNLKTGAYSDGTAPKLSGVKLKLTVNNIDDVIIALYDNTAADALLQRLPLEGLSFYDLSGIEKPIDRLDEPVSLGDETPGYDPVEGEMVIYRPWGIFTIFYGDYEYSDELVPLGVVESGLETIASQIDNFTGSLELLEG